MTRQSAITAAHKYFDDGGFHADLARRVAIPTESQNPERQAELERYLESEMSESLARLGMQSRCSLSGPRLPEIGGRARQLHGLVDVNDVSFVRQILPRNSFTRCIT